jgi:DNA-binding HxlR family transcriptional regulator
MNNEKKFLRKQPPKQVGRMVETVIGCKWSLTVVELVRQGVTRPGAMERSVEGLTAKVLADCLRLLLRYGVLTKQSFPEVPPRVEYSFTAFGLRFVALLESLDGLEAELLTTSSTERPTIKPNELG